MTSNVIHLPRPRGLRTGQEPLAFFVRVGRNDHKEILELISTGEQGAFGFVIEAQNATRHKDLITEARKRDFDVILDPKTQQMAFVGSFNDGLDQLPWGQSGRHQNLADYSGTGGEARAAKIVEYALKHNFTQILAPSHVLSGPNDPWLRRDIDMMKAVARRNDAEGGRLGLIYSLAMPIAVWRDDTLRAAILAALEDAPCDSIWLKIENFGDDATGEKTVAFLKGCQDLHARNIPVVADYVGGLPGLGALAFGAVGGIAHGVTVNQSFRVSSWRRPPKEDEERSGGMAVRVYIPTLDILVKREEARKFFESSQRVKSKHVCRDTHCCGRGMSDMLDRPARHALYQRAREIETINSAPSSVRIPNYLDGVRRVSDDVALMAAFDKADPKLRKSLQEKQKKLGHYRDALSHLAAASTQVTVAIPPLRLSSRKG
jgi:O6-methylguanine-DNA--protein-cysteine methyltransferase